MKRVAELEGAELDYWAALAIGAIAPTERGSGGSVGRQRIACGFPIRPMRSHAGRDYCVHWLAENGKTVREWSPSTRWDDGGPIIEAGGIMLAPMVGNEPSRRWCAWTKAVGVGFGDFYLDVSEDDAQGRGPTPLSAAMRAIVASYYGATVVDDA